MIWDVIVAGAGPAGSAAAGTCAALGLKTLCIEEHGTIGYPVQCAGLLSTAAFEECRISDRAVLNRVSGARVISGRGSGILIDAKKTMALVVDRGIVDQEMAEKAADAGAEFLLRTSVCGIHDGTITTRGIGGRREHQYRILIAADGPRSTIARLLGMERTKVFLAGIQADLPGACDPRYVEIYPDASPDFFGWSIPTGPGRIRIGLCGGSDVPARFRAFRKKFGDTSTHLVTGTLPIGIMPRTWGHRTLFVGDAAGFPKPTSGGGIYTGVRSARHAAVVAAEACSRNDTSDTILSGYENRWRQDFGRELEIGFRLFSLRRNIHEKDMDALIAAMNNPDIIRTIEEYGDMDRPSALVKKLLVKPALIRLIGPLIRSGVRSIFS